MPVKVVCDQRRAQFSLVVMSGEVIRVRAAVVFFDNLE
jgi:hypothetical protein